VAIYGDAKAERTKLAVEHVKHAQLKNAKLEGKLIDLEAACFVAQRAAFAVRQRIMSLPIPEEDRKTLLAEIHALGETDFMRAETEDDSDTADTIQEPIADLDEADAS
jgi:phage terminase Nu1 subunit (DNA packaging protein)